MASSVTIEESAVIGAGSVVTKNIPPRIIVAGNPCRLFVPHGVQARRLCCTDPHTDARSAYKTAHAGTTRPTLRSK